MPKKTKSVFTSRKKSYRRKFSSPKPQAQVKREQRGEYESLYAAMNVVSQILLQMNSALKDVLAPAPDLLKDYMRRASKELHALHKQLASKLPDDLSEPESINYKKPVENVEASVIDELNDIEAKLSVLVKAADALSKTADDLLGLGLMPALREVSIGKTQRAKAFVGMNGSGVKNACRALAKRWKEQRLVICNNNRHDPEEFRELKSALHSDMDEATDFIESLPNNV